MHSGTRRLVFLSAWEHVKSWHAATNSPLCSTSQCTARTAKLKVRNSTIAAKHGALRMMSEAGLVSPATWRKTLSRFLLLIRRRRVQMDSKDPYLLLYNIYVESAFDRLMRVRSMFVVWIWSCPCCKPGWQMYSKIWERCLIWRPTLWCEWIFFKTHVLQVQHYRIKVCPPKMVTWQG